jgi:hypothetical protein
MRNKTPAPDQPISPTEPPDIDFAWKVHAATQDWTKGVDTKSSITFAIIVGFGLFAANQVFGDKGSLVSPTDQQLWSVRAMGAFLGLSALAALWAVFPNLKRRRAKRLADTGLIYFGHLRHRSTDDIEAALANLDYVEMRKQLASNIHATTDIAWKKHSRLQFSHVMLVLAVAAFVLAETVFK